MATLLKTNVILAEMTEKHFYAIACLYIGQLEKFLWQIAFPKVRCSKKRGVHIKSRREQRSKKRLSFALFLASIPP